MPTHPALSQSSLAANDNSPGFTAQPGVVLTGLVDLLAEVCVARLRVANDNRPLLARKDQTE
ncbi:hypothetical protein [Paracoccus niistensis]|uniref:Uncharacterized protein n=1 Tax=Paracoccus niistensis TaxID=632935 RepID=A0ABV6I7B8_9RHOB